jgi:hypothetical protein
MNTAQKILELYTLAQPDGFDWDKINRGDASRFANVFTTPNRWRTGNPVADQQGNYLVDNVKQHKLFGRDRYSDRGRELMAIGADTNETPPKMGGMPESAEKPEKSQAAGSHPLEPERDYNGSGNKISNAQKYSKSQYSKPASAVFREGNMNELDEAVQRILAAYDGFDVAKEDMDEGKHLRNIAVGGLMALSAFGGGAKAHAAKPSGHPNTEIATTYKAPNPMTAKSRAPGGEHYVKKMSGKTSVHPDTGTTGNYNAPNPMTARHEAVTLNKCQEILSQYDGVLPALVDTQNSQSLINLYNNFHNKPAQMITEGGFTGEEINSILMEKDKAFKKAMRSSEKNKWPEAKRKMFADQAAKVAEKEAMEHIIRMKNRTQVTRKNEDAISDFWQHYDKAGEGYDKRFGAARADMANHALGKVLSKVSAPENSLPANVRITALDESVNRDNEDVSYDEDLNRCQQLMEMYAEVGLGGGQDIAEASNKSKLAGTDAAGRDVARYHGKYLSDRKISGSDKEYRINRELSNCDRGRNGPYHRTSFDSGYGYDDDMDDNGVSPTAINRARAAKMQFAAEECGEDVDEGRLRNAAIGGLMALSTLGGGARARADVNNDTVSTQQRPPVVQPYQRPDTATSYSRHYIGYQHNHPDSAQQHFKVAASEKDADDFEREHVKKGYNVVRKSIMGRGGGQNLVNSLKSIKKF